MNPDKPDHKEKQAPINKSETLSPEKQISPEIKKGVRSLTAAEALDLIGENNLKLLQEYGVWSIVKKSIIELITVAELTSDESSETREKITSNLLATVAKVKSVVETLKGYVEGEDSENLEQKVGMYWAGGQYEGGKEKIGYVDDSMKGRNGAFSVGGEYPVTKRRAEDGERKLGGVLIEPEEYDYADQLEASLEGTYTWLEEQNHLGLLENRYLLLPHPEGHALKAVNLFDMRDKLIPLEDFKQLNAQQQLEWQRERSDPLYEDHLLEELTLKKIYKDMADASLEGKDPVQAILGPREINEPDIKKRARVSLAYFRSTMRNASASFQFDPFSRQYNEVEDLGLWNKNYLGTVKFLEDPKLKEKTGYSEPPEQLHMEITYPHAVVNGREALNSSLRFAQVNAGINALKRELNQSEEDTADEEKRPFQTIDLTPSKEVLDYLEEEYGLKEEGKLTAKGARILREGIFEKPWRLHKGEIKAELLEKKEREALSESLAEAGRELLADKEADIRGNIIKLLKQKIDLTDQSPEAKNKRKLQEQYTEMGDKFIDQYYEQFLKDTFYLTDAGLMFLLNESALADTDWAQTTVAAHPEPSQELSPILMGGKRGLDGIFTENGFNPKRAAEFVYRYKVELMNARNGGVTELATLAEVVGEKGWFSLVALAGGYGMQGTILKADRIGRTKSKYTNTCFTSVLTHGTEQTKIAEQQQSWLNSSTETDTDLTEVSFTTAKSYPLSAGVYIRNHEANIHLDLNMEQNVVIDKSIELLLKSAKGDPEMLKLIMGKIENRGIEPDEQEEIKKTLMIRDSVTNLKMVAEENLGEEIAKFEEQALLEEVKKSLVDQIYETETPKETQQKSGSAEIARSLVRRFTATPENFVKTLNSIIRSEEKSVDFIQGLMDKGDYKAAVWTIRKNKQVMEHIFTNQRLVKKIENEFGNWMKDGIDRGRQQIQDYLEKEEK